MVTNPDHIASEPKPPTTTVEEDLKSAGQRRINSVWEYTQAFISISVVLTTCIGVLHTAFVPIPKESSTDSAFSPQWWTILGLVIGFYYGRTNHARVGDYPNK